MSTSAHLLPTEQKVPHPAYFMFLIAPFGASSGFTGVCVAYLLAQAHVSAELIAAMLALHYIPQTWKFLWAPVIDLTLTRKRWFAIGMVCLVLSMLALGLQPLSSEAMPRIIALVVTLSAASTVVGMAVDCLMAHQTPEHAKGRAAGWFQAGNLGGNGLGGGLALWLIHSGGLSVPAGAAVLALACALCSLPIFWLHEDLSQAIAGSVGERLRETGRDLWSVVRSRRGALAMLVVFLPLGTGAMSNMYSIFAEQWGASADTVALVTGTMSGLLSAAGCLLGGYLCDRMNRQLAYCLLGLGTAGISVAMALAPQTETQFIIWTSLYAFANGLCYAAFSAVTLEAIGKGAAATKYNLMASLSNTPIGWSTAVYGYIFGKYGSHATLLTEMAMTVPAVLLFLALLGWSRRSAGRGRLQTV
ncbi:MFS transporter [Paucibacter soli]|uniref:MFS transporter n=1 Tax=Paucibacter soli TaxID=3133433 RepID=UPI0030B75988